MLTAIKVNEDVAKICGINVSWPKILMIVLAGTYASILGAIWGQYQTYITPSTVFYEMFLVVALAGCLLGGMGTLGGPILGTVVFLVLRELSWFVFPDLFLLILGLSLMFTIKYIPNGIYPYLKKRIMTDGFNKFFGFH
jgi:branched-chain amino acid transport system permease protein